MPMSAENNDPFESVTIHSYTAEKFLQNLDETHERWGKAIDWIFRGQNDARWKLIPSLFRPGNWDEDTLPGYEIALIKNFIHNVNLMNLPIPNNSLGYVTNIKEGHTTKRDVINKELSYKMEYDFSHAVFAIAQHSGIPTRLLDFTHNPLVAAYFAADATQLYEELGLSTENKARHFDKCVEISRNSKENEGDLMVETVSDYLHEHNESVSKLPQDIAVWAIRHNDLRKTTLHFLSHPYTEILNLRLQMGVFLCETKSYEYETEGKPNPWRSFDTELANLVESKGIYKLTLPFSQIPALLDLLGRKRISPLYLKPTYEKVAKTALGIAKELNKKNKQ